VWSRLRESVASDEQAVSPVVRPAGWLANASVTRAALWANVVMYGVALVLARSPGAIVETPERVMLALGANYARATVGEHRFETLLTSSFLHFSILHLAFNLYALRQICPPIERNIGSGRMAPMFLVSGIAGSAASAAVGWISGEDRMSAGASGAICGVIGAALVLGLRAEGTKSRLARAMARWLVMLLVIQFVAQVAHVPAAFDNAAHFGGATAGAAFSLAWRRGPPYAAAVRALVLASSAAALVAAFGIVAWRDTHDPFALLRASPRYELAQDLLRKHRCGPAGDAILATERLIPHTPEVLALQQEQAATCPESAPRGAEGR